MIAVDYDKFSPSASGKMRVEGQMHLHLLFPHERKSLTTGGMGLLKSSLGSQR